MQQDKRAQGGRTKGDTTLREVFFSGFWMTVMVYSDDIFTEIQDWSDLRMKSQYVLVRVSWVSSVRI